MAKPGNPVPNSKLLQQPINLPLTRRKLNESGQIEKENWRQPAAVESRDQGGAGGGFRNESQRSGKS